MEGRVRVVGARADGSRARGQLAIVDAIGRGDDPPFAAGDERVIHSVARELTSAGRLGQELYDAAQRLLGDEGMVELVSLCGYYTLISYLLNAFAVPLPPGAEPQHIVLWKAGSSRTRTVPGSGTGHATHVAIAAGPSGHLSIAWYDSAANKIREVRTNGTATGFGKVRTISAPPSTGELDGLQLQGSRGPLDLVALILQNKIGAQPAYWAAEIKP